MYAPQISVIIPVYNEEVTRVILFNANCGQHMKPNPIPHDPCSGNLSNEFSADFSTAID